MITDDDKKAAESYADKASDDAWDFDQDFDRECCIEDFLAGVQNARKPHVVADGDLPEYGQNVIALCSDNRFRIMPLEFDGVGEMWWQDDFYDYGYELYFVKYWWPLPKVEK